MRVCVGFVAEAEPEVGLMVIVVVVPTRDERVAHGSELAYDARNVIEHELFSSPAVKLCAELAIVSVGSASYSKRIVAETV